MKRRQFLLSLVPALLMPTVAYAQSVMQSVDWQPFVPIVTDYVRESRQWRDDQYTIEFVDWDEDSTLVFSVHWKWPSTRIPIPGGDGKSFLAVVDPASGKVVRELREQ